MSSVAADRAQSSAPDNWGPYQRLQPIDVGGRRILRASGVDLDIDAIAVKADGQVIYLPYKEFELLKMLMEFTGRVVPRQAILDEVWMPGHQDTNKTLEVHMMRLRRRLAPNPDSPQRLRTVRGRGYVFDILD